MRLTRVFFNVFMGCGFEGLSEIAKDSKTDIGADSCVCFVNRPATAFKLMVGGQYLTYYKNNGKKIPLEALRLLPEKFGGSKLEFDAAVRKSIEKQIGPQ